MFFHGKVIAHEKTHQPFVEKKVPPLATSLKRRQTSAPGAVGAKNDWKGFDFKS